MADLAAPPVAKTAESGRAASAEPETGRHPATRQTLKSLRLKRLLLGVAETLQSASSVVATDAKWPAADVSDGTVAQPCPAKAPSNRRPLPATNQPCPRPSAQRNRGLGQDDVAPDDVQPLRPRAVDQFGAIDPSGDHANLVTSQDVRIAPPSPEINGACGGANAPAVTRSAQSQHHCTQE